MMRKMMRERKVTMKIDKPLSIIAISIVVMTTMMMVILMMRKMMRERKVTMMIDKPLSMVAISPHRARSPPRPWINFSALSFRSLHNFIKTWIARAVSRVMQESSTKHNMNVKTYQVSGCTSRCCPPGLSSSSSWRQTHRSTLAACQSPGQMSCL